MSVKIITNQEDGYQVLYCSTTMQAFGPVHTEEIELSEFLEWLPQDARKYDQRELDSKYYEWLKYEKEQEEERASERAYENRYEGDGNFADNH